MFDVLPSSRKVDHSNLWCLPQLESQIPLFLSGIDLNAEDALHAVAIPLIFLYLL